jgi:hypothetical protein
MTDFTDVGISHELKLQSANVQELGDDDIIKGIWWFEDGKWDPQGIDRGPVYAMFRKGTDQEPEEYLNLFEIISTSANAPLLVIDQGFIVKKDINAGGFVASNQGELWLGSGRADQVDIPKIILSTSSVSRVQGGGPLNVPAVPSGTQFPTGENGKVAIRTDSWNGNPANTLYKHNGTTWIPKGPTSNYGGYFDTLYLKKANASDPAHLDLGNLTAHGDVTVQKDNPRLVLDTTGSGNPEILLEDAKLYRSASGGSHFVMEKPLVVEQSLWCYDLASDNFGFGHDGNLSMGNGIQFASAINFWRDLSNNFNMDSHLLLKKSDVKLALISPDYTDVGIEFAPNNTWKMKIGYSVAGDFIYFWNFPASATKLYVYASGDVVSEGTGFGARINPYGLGQFAASAGDSGWVFLYSKVDGESYPRFKVTSAGDIWWGCWHFRCRC